MPNWTTKPRISVVIPSHNRLDALPQTLASLADQDWAEESFEVLVIDDGSEDGTMAYLSKFSRTTSLRFQVFLQEPAGPAAARNRGVDACAAPWVLFLDADTPVQRHVVRCHWERQTHLNGPTGCWLGRIDPSPALDRWQQYRWNEFAVDDNGAEILALAWHRYRTPNSSMSLAEVREVGAFDPAFRVAEDAELAFRLHRNGMRFWYDRRLIAYHQHPCSLTQLLYKAEAYGRAAALWSHKHPDDLVGLARRTGIYRPEMGLDRKLVHLLKIVLVNRYTLPMLTVLALHLHKEKRELSKVLLTQLYRYQVRKAYRQSETTAAHGRSLGHGPVGSRDRPRFMTKGSEVA